MLSIVIPAYNEESNIPIIAELIDDLLTSAHIDYEVIFVNDGSTDKSWNCIVDSEKMYGSHITGLNFSRNFGKDNAIFAGLSISKGNYIAVLDCDLQHPPEKLLEMYALLCSGNYDIVEGLKMARGEEPLLYKGLSWLFYFLIKKTSRLDLSNTSDFKMMSRQVVDEILSFQERYTFFRAITRWVGFRTTSVSYDVQARKYGESGWPKYSLVKYALRNIAAFSSSPMQIVSFLSIWSWVAALIIGAETIFMYVYGDVQDGFTTVILLILIIGSVLMTSLGIIGFYLSRLYEEVKNRPRFIVRNSTEKNDT